MEDQNENDPQSVGRPSRAGALDNLVRALEMGMSDDDDNNNNGTGNNEGSSGKDDDSDSPLQMLAQIYAGVMDTVEHVVRTGDYLRHEQLRIKSWRERQQHQQTQYVDHDQVPLRLFAQEARLYSSSKEGVQNAPWPAKRKRLQEGSTSYQISDQEWENELGDAIHPVAFCVARLASSNPTNSELVSHCETLDLDPLNRSPVRPQDACRALLYRSWERAVHANNTVLPVNAEKRARHFSFFFSKSSAQARCKKLGIKTPGPQTKRCPCCRAKFGESNLLEAHFFGTRNTRGCAWNLITEKEQEEINRVLVRESEKQIQGLLRLVISALKSRDDGESNKRKALMDWQDILGILQSTMVSSSSTIDQVHGGDELPEMGTIAVDDGDDSNTGDTLPINEAVLQSLRQRLESRYNDSSR